MSRVWVRTANFLSLDDVNNRIYCKTYIGVSEVERNEWDRPQSLRNISTSTRIISFLSLSQPHSFLYLLKYPIGWATSMWVSSLESCPLLLPLLKLFDCMLYQDIEFMDGITWFNLSDPQWRQLICELRFKVSTLIGQWFGWYADSSEDLDQFSDGSLRSNRLYWYNLCIM